MNFTTKIQRVDRSEIAPSEPFQLRLALIGKDAYSVWEVMDELLSVLQATNPRLYDGVMRKIEEI